MNLFDQIRLLKFGATHPLYTDTLAEIQNTLRAGTDVKLSEVEIGVGDRILGCFFKHKVHEGHEGKKGAKF